MSPFRRYRTLVILAAVLLSLSLLVYFTKQDPRQLTLVEGKLRDILSFVERPVMRATKMGQSFVGHLTNLAHIEQENEWLRDRVAFLESQNQVLEEDKRENLRLHLLLGLRESVADVSTIARVIARDPAHWVRSLLIDKGKADGIAANMAVIAPGGLVGRVESVSSRTASVLLILDGRSAVSALVRRSRDIVICEGSSDPLGGIAVKPLNARLVGGKLEWSSQVRMRVGDLVISSGLGGVFPKGIPIGRITSIGAGRYGVSKSAVVKPAADLDRLEEVLVLAGAVSPQVSPMAPGELEVQ